MVDDRRGFLASRSDSHVWPETAVAVSPLGRQFLQHWHAKCPPGAFPCRSDIAPEELGPLLPYIFLIDIVRDGGSEDNGPLDFRFRLVGTAIVNLEGEHTGKLLSDLFPDRKAYPVLWRHYFDAAAGRVWVRHETLRWQDRDHIGYEVILAPLQDDSGQVNMLIGIAHAQE